MSHRRELTSLLLVLVVAGCARSTPEPAASPGPASTSTPSASPTPDIEALREAAMMYQQDFETGIPGGLFVDADWKVEVDESGNHVFCSVPMDGWPGAVIGHPTWADYAAEMRVRFDELGKDQGVALQVRKNADATEKYAGELNYSEALLSFHAPYAQIGLLRYKARAGHWYTLRVEAAADQFRFLVNEATIARGADSSRSEGSAGFVAFPNTRVCVDDIRIWALDQDGSVARFEAPPTPAPVAAISPPERLASHRFPRIMMHYGGWWLGEEAMRHAALGDLLILEVEDVVVKPEYLGPAGIIRAINPNAVILTYWSALDLQLEDHNFIRQTFNSQVRPEWRMQDTRGQMYYLFPAMGTDWNPMLDPSTELTTFMPQFLNEYVMQSGLVDGIFFDWLGAARWMTHRTDNPPSGSIDVNRDAQRDSDQEVIDTIAAGLSKMLSLCRDLFPAGSLLTGNSGGTAGALVVTNDGRLVPEYPGLLNGRQLELFLSESTASWMENMRAAALMDRTAAEPKLPIFQTKGEQNDFDVLRYTLASALMFNGYYARTEVQTWFNAAPNATPWWYDEYSVDLDTGQAEESLDGKGYLGMPVSEGYNAVDSQELLLPLLLANDASAAAKVWRRDFQNGIVLVNPTGSAKTVDLGGTFRKILGFIDPQFNDGSVVAEVTLPARGGIVLLNMP